MWMLQFLIGIHCCIDYYMYTGLAWIMFSKPADFTGVFNWDFEKSTNKQTKILRDYLDEMYKIYNITTEQ